MPTPRRSGRSKRVRSNSHELSLRNLALETSLKCIKCKKLAVSPVHSCMGGHIFCGTCCIELRNCECGESLMPCLLAESLLKSADVTLKCRNAEAGCTNLVKAWEMKDHLEMHCGCRPVKCFEKKPTECGGKICSQDEFLGHLIVDHKIGNLRFDNESPSRHVRFETICDNDEINGDQFDRGETDYFKFDDRTFLLHQVREQGVFYRWLTLIGHEVDAEKYRFKLWFAGIDNPSAMKFQWLLPVHSVWYGDFEKVKNTGGFASYHSKSLKSYAKQGVMSSPVKRYDYIWAVDIQMIKI